MKESEEGYSVCPFLYIKSAEGKGRGVFTDHEIPKNTIIEESPVLVLCEEERQLLEKTELYNYIFEWGTDQKQCCVAWGYVSLYNHHAPANCEYLMDFENNIIQIRTVRNIQQGEELTINYSADWNNEKPVWFPIID